MKAVVFHAIGDIRLEDVSEPSIQDATDAIVRITASAICGTDLHMIRGTFSGMEPGTIIGHEGVGVVEELGRNVRNVKVGDRVIIPSTIACGTCSYCRAGYYAQCDNANPNGPQAGTAFFGGPKASGPFNGLQAEYARVPYANIGLVKIPDNVTDEQAILLSDIFPTGYFGADMAEIEPGDTVAVYGCGPVGQFAIASAKLMDAGRIIAIDCVDSRLELARKQGAEVIDFNREDPVQVIRELTNAIGVDRVIDAVGVDAQHADHGPAAASRKQESRFEREVEQVAPNADPSTGWKPGGAPSQVVDWAVKSVAKAGTLSIIGVYPPAMRAFPLGEAMNKNLAINMGNCHHRRYIPTILDLVQGGMVDPTKILSNVEPLTNVLDAYKAFNEREPGWIKVELVPGL